MTTEKYTDSNFSTEKENTKIKICNTVDLKREDSATEKLLKIYNTVNFFAKFIAVNDEGIRGEME